MSKDIIKPDPQDPLAQLKQEKLLMQSDMKAH